MKDRLDAALEILAGQLPGSQDPRSCPEKNVIFPFVAASLITFGCMLAGALFVKYFKKVDMWLVCFLCDTFRLSLADLLQGRKYIWNVINWFFSTRALTRLARRLRRRTILTLSNWPYVSDLVSSLFQLTSECKKIDILQLWLIHEIPSSKVKCQLRQ